MHGCWLDDPPTKNTNTNSTTITTNANQPPRALRSGDFDLLDDDLSSTPISARLESDEKILWSSHSTDTEGIFEVTTHVGGKHRLCLENGKHFKDDGLQRHIGWAIRVRKQARALQEDVIGPDQERALELVNWAEALGEEWESLLDHYGYLRDRETTHTVMSASIMSRVVRWTILEGLSLFLIAFCQVMYLRKFFEKRRYL